MIKSIFILLTVFTSFVFLHNHEVDANHLANKTSEQTLKFHKFIRYNLFKRVEMWELEVKVQVDLYKEFLDGSYRMLDSVIAAREREYKIIYWVFNPQT